MSSPPSTPSRSAKLAHFNSFDHRPLNSSPLASSIPSSPASSPGAQAHARRRSQYKAPVFSSPTATRTGRPPRRRVTLGGDVPVRPASDGPVAETEEAPRKHLLRERFRQRCIERAQRDRERKISGKRRLESEPSSDGIDEIMDDEDDEDDEAFINDELFRRLISNGKRKQEHQYRLSYADDVGSSFDPDMQDVGEWEHDSQVIDTTPADLDEEELAVYAEEYELHLNDIRAEDLFSLSDLDDFDFPLQSSLAHGREREVPLSNDDDVDMTM